MSAAKHIKGTLTPTNLEAVNEKTRDKILDAGFKYQLGLAIKSESNDGIINLNGLSPLRSVVENRLWNSLTASLRFCTKKV
jgi:hypothetical protein